MVSAMKGTVTFEDHARGPLTTGRLQRDNAMATFSLKCLLMGSMTALAACAGAGGDDVGGQDAMILGNTDPAAPRSGLDYADGTQDLDDLKGQTHSVRVVRNINQDVVDIAEQVVSDERLTFTAGEARNSLTLTLDGETLTFIDGAATRADGSDISIHDQAAFASLEHVIVSQIIAEGAAGGRPGETTHGHFVTGFETNPEAAAVTTGSATYAGVINGDISTGGGLGAVDGTFTLNAAFDDGLVSGDFDLEDLVSLALAPTAITGNGFAGDLTVTDCRNGDCAADSQIGGIFFGPNAEEVAGAIVLNLTTGIGTEEVNQINGTAGFGGTRQP